MPIAAYRCPDCGTVRRYLRDIRAHQLLNACFGTPEEVRE